MSSRCHKPAIIAVFLLLGVSISYAENTLFTTGFPFINIPLNPGDSLQANYSFKDRFGPHPMIFCYQNSYNGNAPSTLIWPYKGNANSAAMPVTLVTNANYSGSFADFNGTLTVQNTSNVQVFVNCQYAF